MARRKRSGILRWLKWLAIAIGVVFAIPLVLTPVYLFIDPVSVPMLERYVTAVR